MELCVACQSFECLISYHIESGKARELNICEIKGKNYLAVVDNSCRYLKHNVATFQQSEGPIS